MAANIQENSIIEKADKSYINKSFQNLAVAGADLTGIGANDLEATGRALEKWWKRPRSSRVGNRLLKILLPSALLPAIFACTINADTTTAPSRKEQTPRSKELAAEAFLGRWSLDCENAKGITITNIKNISTTKFILTLSVHTKGALSLYS